MKLLRRPTILFIPVLLGALAFIGTFPTTTLAQRPLGTDVSHWQGPDVDWGAVRQAGVTFAWCKATETTNFTDDTFAINQANARAAGIPIGAYHFARPSKSPNLTGARSAESEAAYYWSVVGPYITNNGTTMIPMLDWEDVNCTNQLTTAQMSAWVVQWCNSISNYARANGVEGLKPIIYTGVWYSKPNATYSGLNTSVTSWPSWIANYTISLNPPNGPGPSSANCFPWTAWNFWQYAATNWSGGDSDVFNGTAATLQDYLVGGNGAPYFVTEPSDRTMDRGQSVTMTAPTVGAATRRYQWRFAGANLANATNSSLTLTNVQATNAGNYTVVVTNSLGSITSRVAVLTVNALFTPVFADNFDTDTSASWTLNRSSTDSRVSFSYNYAPYGIPSAPHSVGGSTKGVKFEANVSAAVAGALNISPIGQSFGGNFRLRYDLWINANGSFPFGGAGSTQHQTAGLGTSGSQVQWTSATANSVWFAIDGEGQATDTAPDIRVHVGSTLQTAASGVYVGGTTTEIRRNSHPYYANLFPGSQFAPVAQAQVGPLERGTVGFAWHDVVINKTGNTVEWFIDGLKIATVNGVNLTASNIFVGYWDTFSSLSSNTNLSFALVDNLRVEVPAVAPTITAQPQPIAVVLGSNATFTATGSGIPAPAYQWRFSGTNIIGATATSYTRMNAQLADAGSYSVVLTNVAGGITSSPVTLTVNVPPGITAQPQPVAVKLTSNATFTVTATGTLPLSYQWRFNNAPIGGATNSAYTRSNVQTNEAGNYSVVITNAGGTITSTNALLSLLPPQPAQFQSIALLPDLRVQLVVNVEPGVNYLLLVSSNLTHWTTLTNFTSANGTFHFTDDPTTNAGARFYRAQLGP